MTNKKQKSLLERWEKDIKPVSIVKGKNDEEV